MAVGSTVGAISLSALVELKGFSWILEIYPGLNDGQTWKLASEFFENYDILFIFLIAIAPVAQQPTVIMASLADTTFFELAVAIFSGRFIKFLIMAYIGAHMPKLLKKYWLIRGET
ncbi:MAG: hypothetical protein A2504_12935 [Bdellovibrionales bacterium RIFOXYD12_FULL_39_22]|nr:MAG: hypothetical protein A2385_11935 [Bdellovibrionales bacterium RIFOXYB1_FULL_39_21]OFZ48934.1 MAG: hypothetical protein A2404_14145 [Bdellovibrionales bacterium RIFOXYC1_FULL_39_130]OFZ77645.1 MAG: hypothetical protein A2560_04780 [Bdellovibrionales bacterium RIFOXYD1_FULL_39_84]OFZ96099.1 MAG: hypothetical protein A2504_12935 [Bdellovibrionales bacterium RIFOXYD12_FULL_39_22]HLE11638.1 hypothetical protein [Bacteriovoracaceae bacterium]